MYTLRATLLGFLIVTAGASAAMGQQLSPMDAKAKRQVIGMLKDHLGKLESPQVKIDPDPAGAAGLRFRQDAILLVPQKDLPGSPDDASNRTEVRSPAGAGLAYLLLSSRFTPVIDGKTVEAKKLRTIEVDSPRGGKQSLRCLLLAVRQVSDEDWRLLVYGAEKEPLIDVLIDEAPAKQKGPVAIRVEDVSGRRGTLVVNVLEEYEAGFQLEYGG